MSAVASFHCQNAQPVPVISDAGYVFGLTCSGHGELDMRTPLEVEEGYYADLESAQPAPAGQGSR